MFNGVILFVSILIHNMQAIVDYPPQANCQTAVLNNRADLMQIERVTN
jgi:hypothetical protein